MSTRIPADFVDSSAVLRVYSYLVGTAGVIVAAWGPIWTPAAAGDFEPFLLTRVFGAIMIAAALCAAGLERIEDPSSRHRALFWFLLGHAVVSVVLTVQEIVIRGRLDAAAGALVGVSLVLFHFWAYPIAPARPRSATTQSADVTLHDRRHAWLPWSTRGSIAQLHSEYERRIRTAAQQEERYRLARDVHDGIKQQLFVIQTAAATAQERLTGDVDLVGDALIQVRSATREAMTELDAMLRQMQAAPVANSGLATALREQCEALAFRSGVEMDCRLGTLPDESQLPLGAQETIFRVAQEALANIGRHARGRHASLTLDRRDNVLRLGIADDGQGFDARSARVGMGTTNMQQRAAEIGGRLTIESEAGAGTTITLEIPLMDTSRVLEVRRRMLLLSLGLGVTALATVMVGPSSRISMAVIIAASALASFARFVVITLRLRERCA
jgi:signal transduction histidine kinase